MCYLLDLISLPMVFSKARNKIKNRIMQNEFGNFELILEGVPTLDGIPIIGGSRLLIDIQVRFEVQIEYQQCIDVWDYLESGEECTIEQTL